MDGTITTITATNDGTGDPLRDAMQALRNSRTQAPGPMETAPGLPKLPPSPPAGYAGHAGATPGPPPGARSMPTTKPKDKPHTVATTPPPVALVPEIVEDCESGIPESQNGIKEEMENGILEVSGMPESEIDMPKINIKDQLTEKEVRFIGIYLTGNCNMDEALRACGYEGYNSNYLYRLGKKIVEKYESSAGEHRKIMRAMGYGETTAIANLIDSATNAKSEIVKLTARTTLAKCLGLFSDAVVVNQGIQIVIKGRGDDSGRPAARVLPGAPKAIPKAIAILK